jgi:hypothetical protein
LTDGLVGLGYAYFVPGHHGDTPVSFSTSRHDNNTQIALEELRAVVLAIQDMKSRLGSLPDVIILAIDSMHAKSMIVRGAARSDAGRSLLRELYAELGSCRLSLSYIPSKDNPADELSRDKPLDSTKWRLCLEKLVKIAPLALANFHRRGFQIIQMEGLRRERDKKKIFFFSLTVLF